MNRQCFRGNASELQVNPVQQRHDTRRAVSFAGGAQSLRKIWGVPLLSKATAKVGVIEESIRHRRCEPAS